VSCLAYLTNSAFKRLRLNGCVSDVAPKAAHEPFNPAPWYAGHWEDSWPPTEPRPVAWNCSAESRADHHGNIATEDM
jgi:hypothetical protein